MSAPQKQGRRGRRRTPWRENVEALIVAIVMAVFLKYFIVEAYKIPTGSMQPTLMGQAFPGGGGVFDRILVDKLSYHVRAPERFEVVVFKYPLDRSKNFVKRLWGLPGEDLRIERGDVWVRDGSTGSWHIPRRPTNVRRSAWKPLDLGSEDPQPSWQVVDGNWRHADRELEARGDGRARFAGHGSGSIMDGYLDGYPRAVRTRISRRNESGINPVGDLRVAGRVRALAGCRVLAVELTEGERRYRFELPGPASAEGAAPRVILLSPEGAVAGGPREAIGEPWRLPAGRWVEFAAHNLDDLLELEVDGEPIAALEVAPASDQTSAAFLAQEGEGADLDELQVYRDVFYTPNRNGKTSWQIPAGHFFMLGDNTQDSSDSREWTLVNVRWRADSGGEQSALANSRPTEAPDTNPMTWNSPEGRWTRVRDEWGEVHVFPASAESVSANSRERVARATVPRELITGRAVLVFWPIAPRLGLLRLRWVH